MTDPSMPTGENVLAESMPPDPGLVPPIRDRGGLRQRRDRGHRRVANAIARELQDSLAKCRAAGGQCGTIEAALALACQRLGGCAGESESAEV